MSILSDRTIRELCAASLQVRDYESIRQSVFLERSPGRISEEMLERFSGQDLGSLGVFTGFEHTEVRLEAERRFMAQDFGMIYPFEPDSVRKKIALVEDENEVFNPTTRKLISYGTSSYGYDVTLGQDIKLFTNLNAAEIDPKRFNEQACLAPATIMHDVDGAEFVRIPPNSYLLGATNEYFRIPRDIMVVCLGKSTYARSGAIVNVTPIEPGFEGNVVLEISNSTPLPLRVYLNEGIAQFMFFRGDAPCEVSYADRDGKYQGQTGVTLSKV